MGGGFGSKTAADDYAFIARRARPPDRPAGPLRAHAARGEPRRRQPQRDDPAARRRRPRRRHADRARRRVRERRRLVGLELDDRGADAERSMPARTSARSRAGAQLNLPPMKAFRAPGYVEGTFGLECLLDELAGELELDPLELRRRNHAEHDGGRTRLLEQEPARVLPARRAALGAAGTRCGPARPRRSSAASGWPRRSGGAAAARRATPGSGSARTGTRRSSPRARTSAPASGRRSPRSPPRSSGCRSPTSPIALGDSERGPYATLSAGSSTLPSMGPAVRAAAADAAPPDPRARRPALRARRRHARARRRLDRPPRRRAQAADRDRRPARERPDPRHRARAGRTRPG